MIARARRNNGARKRRANAFDRTVGVCIRRHREQTKLSQAELGEGCGVSFQQIQKYEHGIDRVSLYRFIKIAKTLDMPPWDLLTAILHEAAP